MTLLYYEIFYTAALEGSFVKAAKVLNMTPSAVSHAISAMEKECGFPLFTRSKTGNKLTSFGENLYPQVLNVLNSNESLLQSVHDFHGLKKGTIRLGVFNSVCTSWIPNIVQSFTRLYPHILIEIYQGTYDDVIRWLKTGLIDIGFLSASCTHEFTITPIYYDPLLCVVPKGFTPKNGHYITIHELTEHSFVIQREACDADVQNILAKYHLKLRSNCHVIDDQSTIAMVESGFGICLMPELTLENVIIHNADVYPLYPKEYRIIGLAFPAKSHLTPASRKMLDHIKTLYHSKF